MARVPGVIPVALAAIVGCAQQIERGPPWPDNAWVVVAMTDPTDTQLIRAPIVVPPGGSLAFELDPDIVVRLHAWAFLSESDGGPRLASCGVRSGGNGRRLRRPLVSWVTPATVPTASTAFTFLEATSSALERFDLRETCEGSLCSLLSSRIIEAPFADRRIDRVVGIDDDAVVVSTSPPIGAGDFDVWIVSQGEWRPVRNGPGLIGAPVDLDRDPERDRIVGAVAGGRTFEIDAASAAIVAVGTTTVGLEQSTFGGERWVRFGAVGVSVVRGPALPAFQAQVLSLAMVDLQTAALTSTGAIYYFDGGSAFKVERINKPGEIWSFIAGDDEALGTGGSGGEVLVRDPLNAIWTSSGRAFRIVGELRSLQPIGRGRLLLVGDHGLVAIYNRSGGLDGSCTVMPSPVETDLLALGLSPSRRTAFAVGGSAPGGNAVLLRIDLP